MRLLRATKAFPALSLTVLLAACTATAPREQAPVESRELPTPAVSAKPRIPMAVPATSVAADRQDAKAVPAPTSGASAATLLAKADQLAGQDQYERAGAALERAISIEPENPLVWHRLAVLRLRQHRYHQVIVMAQKSNRFATDWIPLQATNWELIAQAKTALGDTEGATAAWTNAREFGSTRPRRSDK